MEEQTKAELTPTEKLKQEIADLQSKIKGDEQVIEASTTSIYWNKKRIKLIDSQIKALPVEPEKDDNKAI